MSSLSALLVPAAFHHSYYLCCGTSLAVIREIPVACSDVPAWQEAPAAGVKNTPKMIETFLLWNCDRGKTTPLHGACNNRECFNSTSPRAAKRAWQWKSTNWGRTRKKWKLGKPDCWQLRGETASSDGLRSREGSGCSELWEWGTPASLGPSAASERVSRGSHGQKILQENALEKKCLQSR